MLLEAFQQRKQDVVSRQHKGTDLGPGFQFMEIWLHLRVGRLPWTVLVARVLAFTLLWIIIWNIGLCRKRRIIVLPLRKDLSVHLIVRFDELTVCAWRATHLLPYRTSITRMISISFVLLEIP